MNMEAAPTSCQSDFEMLGTVEKYLSVRVAAMWKVWDKIKKYVSFELVLSADMHHPVDQSGPGIGGE